MNIYIELEVVKRELFGKLLLSLELIDKNFTVYLTTRESINELAKKNKNTRNNKTLLFGPE